MPGDGLDDLALAPHPSAPLAHDEVLRTPSQLDGRHQDPTER